MKWDSTWGCGYPGWHAECSAMASKYLGEQFDIHCGGQDLAPVHHTNEIAQSEAAFGKKPWVKYWLHNEFVILPKGEKMSKSGDNFQTLDAIKAKGFSPLDLRYLFLGTVYRKQLMFNEKELVSARTARKKLFDRFLALTGEHGNDNVELQKRYIEQFTAEVNDDLNTPKALATMWEVLKDDELSDHDKKYLLLQFDKVFGFNLGDLQTENIPANVTSLAEERLIARNQKDWKKADTCWVS